MFKRFRNLLNQIYVPCVNLSEVWKLMDEAKQRIMDPEVPVKEKELVFVILAWGHRLAAIQDMCGKLNDYVADLREDVDYVLEEEEDI